MMNGKIKIIVLIRDVTDSLQNEKYFLKQSEHDARASAMGRELQSVFAHHCDLLEQIEPIKKSTLNRNMFDDLKVSS
jgi:hypothetical protein